MLKVVIHKSKKPTASEPEGEVRWSILIGEALPFEIGWRTAEHIIEANKIPLKNTATFPENVSVDVYSF